MGLHPQIALRERGIIVRVTAATLLVINAVLLVIALTDPTSFGLSTTQVLVLALPFLAIQVVLAALPWERILPERPMPWVLRGTVAYNISGLLVALTLAAEVANAQALWLLGFNVVYSALVLPRREHVIAAAVAVVGAVAVMVATTGVDAHDVVNLTALTGVALLATIGSNVIWGALGRAEAQRTAADDSAAALRDALVAVRSTTTGDVQQILDASARAAVRGPHDMAGAYVIDGSDVLAAFHGVPPELQVTDHDTVRAIVDRIDDRGSAVLDYEGPDADVLEEELRGHLRASMVAPVRRRGVVIGALTVARTQGELFTTGERVALELLADHIARGIVLSRELAADRAALERLQELDRLKRDFVATVSHEMRTPLTVITGLTETLQQRADTLDGDLRDMLVKRLGSNAATLERIVTGLLDTAGIDHGTITVAREDVDVTDLLTETAARLEPLFDEHHLTTDVEPGLHVAGDPGLLERVLENLLTNAERHTPAGTTVELRGRADPVADAVVVEVTDDGPGIPPEDLELVLGRFVRGGAPNERSTRGLGLGLALADEVLRLHDSELTVESEVGAGTTFRFSLRAAPAPLAAHRVSSDAGS